MANKKKTKKKFGLSGGVHGKRRNALFSRKKYTYRVNILQNNISKGSGKQKALQSKLKVYRTQVLRRIFPKRKIVHTNRKLFVEEHKTHYTIKRVSLDEPFRFRISKLSSISSEGYRLMNLDLLQKHFCDISVHVAKCKYALDIVNRNIDPIKLVTESRTLGLASLLVAQCQGCNKQFEIPSSPRIQNGSNNHYDINVRAVWGSMVTGGGVAHLNETMATMNAPGMSQQTYSKIEQEIGDMWGQIVNQDLLAAGAEERRIAIDKQSYHEGVPAITVICDGGWSKRSHKHTYNALGGVAIILGAETGKLLHIGIRNKHCYICSAAESNHTVPKLHRCFKNWKNSSQSMESDIILEGFLKSEHIHGLRYTKVIGDGDSSVFAKLQECVPWGQSIEKVECANHICKCLRSNLEKLVDENPLYKGKNNLPKSLRVRLVSAVRCAIRMRSSEEDKSAASKKLEHDIRNSVHHIYGNHSRCSDFCKSVKDDAKNNSDSHKDKHQPEFENENTIPDLISGISKVWNETTSLELQDESRLNFDCDYDLDALILRDISVLLDRVACKSSKLIGNNTTNLAECWMAIRMKFDGGKLYNRCNRGSWHSRCFGGCLRLNIGPEWSPKVWEKTTATKPGYFFKKLYDQRHTALASSKKSKQKPESQTRRWKRKYQGNREANSKKARQDYGPEALKGGADITPEQLEIEKQSFLDKHINLSEEKISSIELATKKQSISAVWMDERKKRITASNFGSIVKRNPSICVKKLVQTLLYSKFTGNVHTRRGLQEEAMTVKEYVNIKKEQRKRVAVSSTGLLISREHKFLAASPDGKVTEKTISDDGSVHDCSTEVGLIEIKNLLHSKPLNLYEATTQIKNFCLDYDGKELYLKTNHPYFYQVQGQLNVTNLPWVDFIVRTLNPYQIHIQRIHIDRKLWTDTMLPKLTSFYMKALLPELASPRSNTITGIREPGIWFYNTQCAPIVQRKKKNKKLQAETEEIINPPPDPSTSQRITRSKRTTKVKFVGRRIQHEWVDDESQNKTKWYSGMVIGTLKGKDGDPSAVYEILYDGDDQAYSVDHLMEDFNSSSVKFIDI